MFDQQQERQNLAEKFPKPLKNYEGRREIFGPPRWFLGTANLRLPKDIVVHVQMERSQTDRYQAMNITMAQSDILQLYWDGHHTTQHASCSPRTKAISVGLDEISNTRSRPLYLSCQRRRRNCQATCREAGHGSLFATGGAVTPTLLTSGQSKCPQITNPFAVTVA